MLRKFTLLLTVLFVAALSADIALTYSGGPPTGHTGAPGESNCTACHSSFAVNSGTATRTLVLNNDPGITSYTPGQTYTVTYTLSQTSVVTFGFQATVKRANGNAAGTLINPTPGEMSISGNYIFHNSGGNAATGAGQRVWNFNWTAPAAGAGTATFYVAGNATNDDLSSSGDRIYTNSFAFTEAAASAAVNAATFNPAVICRGNNVTVNFTTTGTFTAGNTFTAQLSDASGSFASPVTIGSVTSTTAAAITATIPAGSAAGTGYRIRVVSSNPVLTGAQSTTTLNVTIPSSAPAVSFDGRTLTATGAGPFIWARDGNTIAGATASTYVPTQTGNYTAAVSNNGCSPSTSTGVNVAAGISFANSPASVCPGEIIATNPTTFGTFNANNVFTVELSDNTGSFANPLVIGTVNGAVPGVLQASIPHGITIGGNYRYRLLATSPVAMSDVSTVFTANPVPATPTLQQNGFVITSSEPAGNQWFRNGQLLPNETGTTLTVTQNGRYKAMVTLLNCSSDSSLAIDINNVSVFSPVLQAVKMYPNPVKDQLTLETSDPLTFELHDLQGRLLKSWSLEAGNHQLVTDGLSSGIYLATLRMGAAIRLEKLVIE